MSTRKPKRKPESFDSWCRRAGILPGDPTPAVSSPHGAPVVGFSTEAFTTMLKGPSTMPVLTTTIEVFCLRTGRTFRARGSAVRRERYERAGSEISHYRYLVSCKRCPDTHVLLGTFRAASFDLLGDPIGGLRITQKDRSFGRRRLFTQELFDRKRFPPVETESETEAA